MRAFAASVFDDQRARLRGARRREAAQIVFRERGIFRRTNALLSEYARRGGCRLGGGGRADAERKCGEREDGDERMGAEHERSFRKAEAT